MTSRYCTNCKVRPVAYPASKTSNWCKVCLEEVRKQKRDKNLRQNYRGFSSQGYDELFLKQGGVCAVCGNRQKGHLHVDHDHRTGNVRGLLCSDCNTALGHLHDNPEIIRKLLQYISQCLEEE